MKIDGNKRIFEVQSSHNSTPFFSKKEKIPSANRISQGHSACDSGWPSKREITGPEEWNAAKGRSKTLPRSLRYLHKMCSKCSKSDLWLKHDLLAAATCSSLHPRVFSVGKMDLSLCGSMRVANSWIVGSVGQRSAVSCYDANESRWVKRRISFHRLCQFSVTQFQQFCK